MSTAVTAEVERLARLLRCDPDEIGFLHRFAVTEVRALRTAVSDRMYADHEATYSRIAAASRLLPMKLTAPLAQRMLSPRVAAGVVASLPADQAAQMSARMAVSYVADVATYLSPVLGEPVLTRLSVELINRVADVLCERGDYNTMAEIVGSLTDEQVVAVVESIGDAETLVLVALRVTDAEALRRLARLLPDARLDDMVACTSRRSRLWPQLAGLLAQLPAPQRTRLLSAVRAG